MGEGDSERQTHTDMNKHNWRHPNTIKEGQKHTRHEQRTSHPDKERDENTHTHKVRQRERSMRDRKTMKYKQPPQ